MRDYFVIAMEMHIDYSQEIRILGVYLSEKKAIKEFKKALKYVYKPMSRDCGYYIFEDSDKCFDSGSTSNHDYPYNHIRLTLSKTTNRKWGKPKD